MTRFRRTTNQLGSLFIKYKSRRRFPRMSRRFVRRVNDAIHMPQVIKTTGQTQIESLTDRCAYATFEVGTAGTLLDRVFHDAYANAITYAYQDPTGSLANSRALFFQVHVLKWATTLTFTNTNNHRSTLVFTEAIPRHDIPYGTSYSITPAWCIGESTSGALPEQSLPQPLANQWNFTPYMSPQLVHNYKLGNVKKVVLEPGSSTTVSIGVNNFTYTKQFDYQPSMYAARRGSAKYLIVKLTGPEATSETSLEANIIGTAQVRVRSTTTVQFRPLPSTRPIIDYDVPVNALYTNPISMNEQIGQPQVSENLNSF